MFSRRVPAERLTNESTHANAFASFRIMDTPPEPEYDDLTTFASHVFRVPTAQVSLVDSARQFIKSSSDGHQQDTPREHSFCAHAVTSRSTLTVPDARVDSRFRDNPLVLKGPNIRFYAGAPLIVRNGLCLGTLCVISPESRTDFGPEKIALLEKLASLAAAHIENRLSQSRLGRQAEGAHFLFVDEEMSTLHASSRLNSLPGLDVVAECEPLATLIRASQRSRTYLFQHFQVDEAFLEVEVYPIGNRSAAIIRDITAEYLASKNESRLKLILKASSPLVWRMRPGSSDQEHLDDWFAFSGQAREGFSRERFLDSVHPDDLHNGKEAFRMGATETNYVLRLKRFDGEYRWMQTHIVPRVGADHTIAEWIGVLSDVTQRYQIEEEVRQANERFALVAKAASEAILDIDCRSGETYFSERWQDLFGSETHLALSSMEDLLERLHHRDKERFQAATALLEDGHSESLQLELRCMMTPYSWRWIHVHALAQRDGLGKLVRVTGTARDVTERKTIDPLTGLLNRSAILDRIQDRIDMASRKRLFGLFFLDLDFFKRLNDSMGHDVGDDLLRAVARRLRDTVHLSDRDHVARVGGDEFVVFGDQFAEIEDALTFASMLEHLLGRPIEINGRSVQMSASIGIAVAAPVQGMRAEELLEKADLAMYSAKQDGRSRFVLYSPSMKEQAVQRVELEQDLRQALRRGEFELHYQPVVCVATGQVEGLEALLRWRHPARGVINPSVFIPIAEETGQINAIGEWVFKEAVAQISRWKTSHVVSSSVTVSVNISAALLQQRDFCYALIALCEAAHTPTSAVVLEVTESIFLSDSLLMSQTLAQLANAGFSLDLDDFGTGYSSLSYLHKHPFQRVKIDHSFVGNLETDQRSLSLVSTIIGMAHALGMDVVAEGVENVEQLHILEELGCRFAQGFLFSPPASAQQLESGWLKTAQTHSTLNPVTNESV